MRRKEIDQKIWIIVGCFVIAILLILCLFINKTNMGACMVAGGSWSNGSCSNGIVYKNGQKFDGESDNVIYVNGFAAYTTKIYYTNEDHVLTISSNKIGEDFIDGNQALEESLVTPTDIEKVVIDGTVIPTSTAKWFQGMSNLKEIEGLENLDTSNVTDMSYMFDGCSSLTELDCSTFEMNNVTSLLAMFQGCSSLQKVDLTNWNTLSVEDMSYLFCWDSKLSEIVGLEDLNTVAVSTLDSLFYQCGSIKSLDLTKWRVTSVESLAFTFANCGSLETIDTTGWKTNSLKTMSGTFKESPKLKEVTGLNDWNVQKVVEMNRTFAYCTGFTSLDLSNWVTTRVETFAQMFNGCTNLQSVNMSNFTNASVTSEKPTYTSRPERDYGTEKGYQNMFNGCANLRKISVGDNWNHNDEIDEEMLGDMFYSIEY